MTLTNSPSSNRSPEVERITSAARITDALVERIIDGTYGPGDRIREAALLKEFEVSNGPVREALQSLVGMGLAQRAPWQGVRVVEFGEEEIVHLFELRTAPLFQAELAARITEGKFVAQRLRQRLGKFAQSRKGRPPPVTGDLTEWLLTVAGNNYIADVWHSTMLKTRIVIYRSMARTAGSKVPALTGELIDAVLRRDPDGAREAARDWTRELLADIGIESKPLQARAFASRKQPRVRTR
ncbi:MAG: GntR family transcriptional regulator [Betaproteobacteria bacterium]|nr:GntR family transcriptional regulator [Betaproteobacteria bacterium]